MRTVILGRTGLRASAAGLGTGGHSALGLKKFGQDHAAYLVRTAFEEGINFFDTATKYGTEGAVAQGLEGIPRDQYILSTKFAFNNKDGTMKSAVELTAALEESLRTLHTDYLDIYQIQGIFPHLYQRARDELMPALIKAQEQGKIRFSGASEDFPGDTGHKMLKMALADDCFDVFMLGYNLLNPSAAKTILPQCEKQGVGTLCMYAVRNALSIPERLRANIEQILSSGQADPALLHPDEDLSFLLENGAQLLFGSDTKSMDPIVPGNISLGSVTISNAALLTILVTIVAMAALTLIVQKTKLGKAMRAVSEDMGAAQLMGISLNRTISFTFAIGSALAGIGSVLYLCAYQQASPTMGSMLGLKAFVAAVLGGIGSIPGAMIGGFAIGLLEALVSAVGLSVWKDGVVFAILIVVLLVKPTGILGRPQTEKV